MTAPIPTCLGEFQTLSPQGRAEHDCFNCDFRPLCKGEVEPVCRWSADGDTLVVYVMLAMVLALLTSILVRIVEGALI